MLTDAFVVIAGLLWLSVLWLTALWAEKRPTLLSGAWASVYSLSLAVYCTSWTFFGTVTQARRSGWPIPPTFIGSILLYAFGFAVLLKLLRLARQHNSTSLADLIATRLGKNSWLAAAVTFVAVLGIIPYIALQLKAVAMSYGLLTRASNLAPPAWQDSALYVALAMALFAMLFGTRRASAAEHNRGLVLAMALEALLKLVAMLALWGFVMFGLELPANGVALPVVQAEGSSGFPALIALGALAMLTLPHQFHMGVVECRDEAHLRTARWLFPLYLLLIALPILSLARAGDALLAPLGVPSDMYVLALPLSQGHEGLALFAFLGGLSAATGMVIISTLSLSVMIGNHWLTPLMVRRAWAQPAVGDLRGAVLLQRRFGILGVVLLAWAYSRAIAGSDALADIGAVSFSALATLAPALAFAVWRPKTQPLAVLLGLIAAVLVWSWALLIPSLAEAMGHTKFLTAGPFGWAGLAPDHLMGLQGWSRLGRAVSLSLLSGVLVTLIAAAKLPLTTDSHNSSVLSSNALRDLALRFLPSAGVQEILRDTSPTASHPKLGLSSSMLEARIERELAAVLGSASARLLLNAARREQGRDLDTVAEIVDEASQALRFNQRVLEAALQNMSQGISVVDADLRLVAWNRRYAELFDYPQTLLRVGTPIAALVNHNMARGLVGASRSEEAIRAEVQKRLAHMRAGTPYVVERLFGSSVVEIRGNPMPGGGFVATFTDVTDYRHAETELKHIAESLEQRVNERTAQLRGATAEAERANRAKSRFLAAVSHDLAQPLNAAHLFTHALAQRLEHDRYRADVRNIDGALSSAETLLASLMDISQLDAGGIAPKIQAFCVDELLQNLAGEFRMIAEAKGLALHCIACRAWVRSDPQLLRRVLQNFLANAVRYTERGRVSLGVRLQREHIRIEVWDSGVGIAPADQRVIFEEFRRLNHQGRGQGAAQAYGSSGMGLGLSIAERLAELLGHPITLRSTLGRGTVFAVTVTRTAPQHLPQEIAPAEATSAPPSRVLIVDNDPEVLSAMQALLSSWHCEVLSARNFSEALTAIKDAPPDLLLLDYHLDQELTGLQLQQLLIPHIGARPTIIITADQSASVREAVLSAGCQLLHKPLKPLALKSVMARVLAGRVG